MNTLQRVQYQHNLHTTLPFEYNVLTAYVIYSMKAKAESFLHIKTLLLIFTGLLVVAIFAYITLATFKIHARIQQEKEELLLIAAKNVTQQLTNRFIIPTLRSFGEIQLSLPQQYNLFRTTILASLSNFDIDTVELYSPQGNFIYSTGKKRTNIPQAVQTALENRDIIFKLVVPSVFALLTNNFENTTASIYYPILLSPTILFPFSPEQSQESIFWGTLHITLNTSKEITLLAQNYRQIAIITTIIIAISICIILYVLHRAERVIYAKVTALEKMKQTLNQNERLASMGRTVAAIAHEIRNPLGIIYSSVELALQSSHSLDTKKQHLLQMIQKETARLRTLVNTFLEYAKPYHVESIPVNIVATVEQVTLFLEEILKQKNIQITCSIPKTYQILSEPNIFYRILFNVINNAVEAGDVSSIALSCIKEEQYCIIRIHDNGKGFGTDAVLTDYMEPFYTTKPEGTGLGLSIVKAMMENHNGFIRLENDNGACVSLYFPLERLEEIDEDS